MSNKNKKKIDISELDDFLAKESFTVKEEQSIWAKFGYLTGTGDYHLWRCEHRATITSRGVPYHYIVEQANDINSPSVYIKILDTKDWDEPGNWWTQGLFFDNKSGKWRKPLLPEPMSAEDEAISIIESVVMSCVKAHNKTIDFDNNRNDLFLEKTDFCYTYVGSDKKWHSFYPSLEKLVSYAQRFEKNDFLVFLNSEECYWHREFWNSIDV